MGKGSFLLWGRGGRRSDDVFECVEMLKGKREAFNSMAVGKKEGLAMFSVVLQSV